MAAFLEVSQMTSNNTQGTSDSSNNRYRQRRVALKCCSWSIFWSFVSSFFFLGFGGFVLVSSFGYLGKKLQFYLAVFWYFGVIFVLCGIITGIQCYFHIRDRLLEAKINRAHQLFLADLLSEQQERRDMLPQCVTLMIHEQLQHFGPGEELLSVASSPPAYEMVVQKNSSDAPPPTYVEAVALLNHQQQQHQQQQHQQADHQEHVSIYRERKMCDSSYG